MNVFLLLIAMASASLAIYVWRWSRTRRHAVERLDEVASVIPESLILTRRNQLVLTERVFPTRRRWMIAAAGLTVLLVLRFVAGVAVEIDVAAAILAAILMHLLEEALVGQQISRIEAQLSDAIDLLVASLRAGSSISKAFQLAERESQPPLRPYLQEMVGRLRLGDEPREVILSVADQVPLDTFRLFSQSLAAHWEVGGSLASTLATIGRTVRDRIELSRRVQTQSVEANLSVAAIMALAYALGYLMWRSDPDRLVAFLSNPTGSNLVAGVIGLQAVGLFWMSRISRSRF